MSSIPTYSSRVEAATQALKGADFILIGAGAGLSAGAGLNYQDPALFQAWYPRFASLGLGTIWDGVTSHWAPNEANRRRFWAFWATHIHNIRYAAPVGQVYRDLLALVAARKHFVISTNADGQFVKAGFDLERMYTPQGDYAVFQCETPCSDALYDNRDWVESTFASLDEQLLVAEADIPHCPRCGGFLERNLRIDGRFVEQPYMHKQADFVDFINQSKDARLVLLELGVGFNTPGIIRFPFERVAAVHPGATLIRVNLQDAQIGAKAAARSIGFAEDVAQVMRDLLAGIGT